MSKFIESGAADVLLGIALSIPIVLAIVGITLQILGVS